MLIKCLFYLHVSIINDRKLVEVMVASSDRFYENLLFVFKVMKW